MPQSLGGSDEPDNLALACHRCNKRHYNFTPELTPKLKNKSPYLIRIFGKFNQFIQCFFIR